MRALLRSRLHHKGLRFGVWFYRRGNDVNEQATPRIITEREKSNWAVAHAMVSVRPRLNKALRKAYTHHAGDLASEANGVAVAGAYEETISLMACLREALQLLDLPIPPLPESWGSKT